MYKLSVVVLVYNTEEYLNECIDSLLSQKLDDIEIILVDDESTDDSLNICLAYEEKYDNIKVIQQKNQGGAVAGNNGLKLAKGEYVTIVDSDDIIPINAYSVLYGNAKKHNSDISIGKPLRLSNNRLLEVALDREKHVWLHDRFISSCLEFKAIFSDCYYWNKIFRREFVMENEIFMPEGYLYADRPMVHKAYKFACGISISSEICYYWRKRPSNTNNKSITQNTKQLSNFKERLKSCDYQYNMFKDDYELLDSIASCTVYRLLFNIYDIVDDLRIRDFYLNEISNLFLKFESLELNELSPKEKLLFFLIKEKKQFELAYFLSKLNAKPNFYYADQKLIYNLPFNNSNIPVKYFTENNLTADNIRNCQLTLIGGKIHFQCLIREFTCLERLELVLVSKDKKIIIPLAKNGDYYSAECLWIEIPEDENFYMVISSTNLNSIYLRRTNFELNTKSSFLSSMRLRFTSSSKYCRVSRRNVYKKILQKVKGK